MQAIPSDQLVERSKKDFEWLGRDIFAVKNRYLSALRNKEIPLDDRWALFLGAPSYLKVQGSDICSAELITTLSKNCPDGHKSKWVSSEAYERNQKICIADLVDNIGYHFKHKDDPGYRYRNEYYDATTYDEIREEILTLNLESFIYDW